MITLAAQVGRVASMRVSLDAAQERRFERLMDDLLLIDMHQHTLVMPENIDDAYIYAAERNFVWGYDAIRAGRWSMVGAACNMSALMRGADGSFIAFDDLVDEIGLMLADLACQVDVRIIGEARDVESGRVGVMPVAEHLAIGDQLHRVDVLYGLGVRMAGLTYARRSYIGDGQNESADAGLSDFGHAIIERMNDLGMLIDLSHAGQCTALEAIAVSDAPVIFSHNAAHAVRPTRRTRNDEEFLACVAKGGMVCVTAVPNSLSDDPHQNINCVLDHYDYLVQLLGVDHVGIGTDSTIGDHVAFTRKLMSNTAPAPAAYLDGLESPADGPNLIRGLISRGYGDDDIRQIAGTNALNLLRRVIG
jgi:membrane dipeptidase